MANQKSKAIPCGFLWGEECEDRGWRWASKELWWCWRAVSFVRWHVCKCSFCCYGCHLVFPAWWCHLPEVTSALAPHQTSRLTAHLPNNDSSRERGNGSGAFGEFRKRGRRGKPRGDTPGTDKNYRSGDLAAACPVTGTAGFIPILPSFRSPPWPQVLSTNSCTHTLSTDWWNAIYRIYICINICKPSSWAQYLSHIHALGLTKAGKSRILVRWPALRGRPVVCAWVSWPSLVEFVWWKQNCSVLSNWLPCIMDVLGSRMQFSLKREK